MRRIFSLLAGFAALLLLASIAQADSNGTDRPGPLVSPQWLVQHLDQADIRVIDLRNQIDGGSYETWLEGHIPGSIHSDYLQDGWRVGRNDVVGLLPSEEQFQTLARKLGVNSDTHVVIIPAGVSSTDFGSSARAYWTFQVFGHDRVSILDGGYKAWQAAYPDQIAKGPQIAPAAGNFKAGFRPQKYISTEDVKKLVAADGKAILLDGRTPKQFIGEAKHGKARAGGRIPGAVLLSQSESFDDASGKLKSRDALAKIYGGVEGGQIVSYCNTGHWAATNWFVLSEVLGRKDVKLYDGSMVEWTADEANPLLTGQSNLDKLKGFLKKLSG